MNNFQIYSLNHLEYNFFLCFITYSTCLNYIEFEEDDRTYGGFEYYDPDDIVQLMFHKLLNLQLVRAYS